ncbi:MMPL family transporter [Cohnella sp. LGH]|uniref:MMPL family transporter n=1 Tax=Cohnella sp. LGH TaxID=1619153 RepID=UPI001ADA479C|nr:MMPL family transporter [Cohnella sp. LGH]QTH45401.1 MMPL family transporter [Cohnella sp. LGH]
MTLQRLTNTAIRRRLWIIGFWLILAACFTPLAAKLPDVLGDHGLETDGQYADVQRLLSQELRMPEEPVIVLFHNHDGRSSRSFGQSIAIMMSRIGQISGTLVASSPLERPEMLQREYAYATLAILPGSMEDKQLALERIRGVLTSSGEVKATLTGKPVVQQDVNRLSRTDLQAAEAVGLPIAFGLLVFALGGLLPAVLPLAAGGITVIVSMGMMCLIGQYSGLSLSVFVYNVIPMVGMAVCIDFALLMVSRFREERRGQKADEALRRTMITSGRAVTISAGCVAFALLGTLYVRMPIFNTVALGTLVVLAVSMLVNLTFVPALLYALRGRLASRRERPHPSGRLWRTLANAVMRRPAAAVTFAMGFLLICMFPIRSLEVGVPGPQSLPQSQESRLAAEAFALHFQPSSVSQVWLAVKEGPGSRQAVESIRHELLRDPYVVQADIKEGHLVGGQGHRWISVWLQGDKAANTTMQWLRERDRQYADLDVKIGGEPKYDQEVHDEVFGRMKHVLLFVVLSNFLVLAAAFRSLFIPVKAIAMNLMSIAASFGLLSWLFQGGRFGIEATDIAIMIPVFIFGLTFGISMDYGIFLLSRIYEGYGETRDNDRAIREGLTASGSIIASAAAIMIAVTAPFALADVSGVKQLGIGIAAVVLLDATIVRMLLVPALMKCFGKWNWWLPFVRS